MKRILIIAVVIGLTAFAHTAKYTYDAAGRLTSVSYDNGATITYTYDNAGNLLTRIVTAGNQPSSGSDSKVSVAGKPATVETPGSEPPVIRKAPARGRHPAPCCTKPPSAPKRPSTK